MRTTPERFAIVGMGCKVPGADSPHDFWDNLLAGQDSRSDASGAIAAAVNAPVPDPDHSITWSLGGWIDQSPVHSGDEQPLTLVEEWSWDVARQTMGTLASSVDPRSVGIVMGNYCFPTESSSAVATARLHKAALRTVGVFDGSSLSDERVNSEDALAVGTQALTVTADRLRLGGPQIALDAACASALYALRIACLQLSLGRAEAMIAGAVCAPDPALIQLSFSDLGAYPSNGVSQPFDRKSTGITTGQGAAAVLVRRLDDALASGDEILAVVEGIGWASDGTGRHLLAPNEAGQQRAYADAFQTCLYEPSDVQYVECHATGTHLGDSTEIGSLASIYPHRPLLGSVKGNVGHLLTAAGATSLVKTILSMQHGVIPPTIGVEEPQEKVEGHLVQCATPWPDSNGERVAAISAFGFGGTNAHVILSNHDAIAGKPTTVAADSSSTHSPQPIVVTGMGLHAGTAESLDDFHAQLMSGKPVRHAPTLRRWFGEGRDILVSSPNGAYADEISVSAAAYKISPNDLGQFNPQHLMLLNVVEQAIEDSGLVPRETGFAPRFEPRRVSVLLAMEMEPRTHVHRARLDVDRIIPDHLSPQSQDPALVNIMRDAIHPPISAAEVLSYISNIAASRICARWNFTGPSFSISADTTSGAEVIRLAADMLRADPALEAVVVGAADMAGGYDAVQAALTSGTTLEGWAPGDAGAAMVLRRRCDLGMGEKSYASIEGVGVATARLESEVEVGLLRASARAFSSTVIRPNDVGLVRAQGNRRIRDHVETQALERIFSSASERVWRGDSAHISGDCGHASAMIAAVEAVLCCASRMIPPGSPHSTTHEGNLPVSETPLPWVRRSVDSPRVVSVSSVGRSRSFAHMIFAAAPDLDRKTRPAWSVVAPEVLLLKGPDVHMLAQIVEAQIRGLQDNDGTDFIELCRRSHSLDGGPITAVVIGKSADDMVHELSSLKTHLESSQTNETTVWSTPAGSYFTPIPIGPRGKLAVTYPGAFTAYPGSGCELYLLFPELQEQLEKDSLDSHRALRTDVLWHPDSFTRVASRAMAHEGRMVQDIPTMLTVGTTLAMQGSDALLIQLGLNPAGSLGYSLGEASMLFSLGVWDRSSRSDEELTGVRCFRDGLVGKYSIARRAWGLSPETKDADVWTTRLLKAPAERVRAVVAQSSEVWITHVNTATECVVAGRAPVLRELVEREKFAYAKPPVNPIMHCDLVDGAAPELKSLNAYPVVGRPKVDFYSIDGYAPISKFETEALADGMVRTLASLVDWPKLVHRAFADGYRYFVEVGPSETCSRWTKEAIGDLPHVAVSLDRRGQKLGAGVIRVIAHLVSNGYPLDFSRLWTLENVEQRWVVRIPVGSESSAEGKRSM